MLPSTSTVKRLEEECLHLQERIQNLQGYSAYDCVTRDALLSHSQLQLWGMQEAMERSRSGTYGICEVCQEPIEPERMKTLPATPRCSECARNERR